MKTFNLILLSILIILIAGFFTKKLLAPEAVIPAATQQPELSLKDGRQCYTYSHEATPDSPYVVQEIMDITINGTQVSGTKRGTQNGPDMTNGYDGTISGEVSGNTINAVFSYVVEGSANKEKEIYRTSDTGIEKLRYPLIEKDGMLVPDTTKDFTALSYARIGCTSSN